MGFWDKLKGELIDVIEWIDDTGDTIVYRFERYGNEIKNGAKLIVRESQVAIFVSEGEIADVFTPGTYTLETKNLPVLSTLKGWKYGFKSPFKAEVYFVSTKLFKNQKWGTPNVFYIRDKDYGRVALRAFGTYSFKVKDAVKFLKEVVGVEQDFTTEDIKGELRSLIITSFIDAIAESGYSLLDLASKQRDLSKELLPKLQEEFVDYGLEIVKFWINSITLPEELQKKFYEGAGMDLIGDMGKYQQMKMAEAMGNAAQNPAGMGGGLEGILGIAFMQQMVNQQGPMGRPAQAPQPMAPPPPPVVQFFAIINGNQTGPLTLDQIKTYISQGLITPQTLVWKQGMPSWAAANSVPELAGLFVPTAPPPPPPNPQTPPPPPNN